MTARRSRWYWPLGSVGGVEVRVHASFLILVAVVAVAAAVSGGDPGVVSSVVWLVPLFASVLVHEVAHTVVAHRYGVEVREIDLLPIGGLSRLAGRRPTPGVEARIALAGPLASFGLAVVCAAGALLTGGSLLPPTLYAGHVLVRLAWVNLALGAFNLLPALPLDGGRVYEATLEQRVGRVTALRTAARVARDLSLVLVLVGFLVSPLLLIVGVFLHVASSGQAAAADLVEALGDTTVADVMRSPAVRLTLADLGPEDAVLDPDEPLERSGLLDHDPELAAVVRDDQVLGVVTAADADRLVRRLTGRPAARPVPPPPPPPAAGVKWG